MGHNTYYNPVNLDSVAARIKLDANGNVQAKAWSSLKFRTNTVGAFSEGGMASYGLRVDGLCSATPSPPITKAPDSGQRYSVYYHEQETWTIGGAPVRSKYWLHLDSNPSTVSDQQSYANGVRNPPASSSQTGDTDGNGYLALFTATQSLTTCQTSNNHGGSHPHQRYQLKIQLHDLDHRQQWDQASQKAGDVADWAKAGLELKNMDKPSLANIFLADRGTLLTWFFVAAQTGNVASATINEFDIGPLNGDPSSSRPGSRFNSFPSFVLTDVVLPGHLLRDSVQDFTETRSFP